MLHFRSRATELKQPANTESDEGSGLINIIKCRRPLRQSSRFDRTARNFPKNVAAVEQQATFPMKFSFSSFLSDRQNLEQSDFLGNVFPRPPWVNDVDLAGYSYASPQEFVDVKL